MTRCFDLQIAVKVKDTIAAHQTNIPGGTAVLIMRPDIGGLPLITNTKMEDKDMVIIKAENIVQADQCSPSTIEGFFM